MKQRERKKRERSERETERVMNEQKEDDAKWKKGIVGVASAGGAKRVPSCQKTTNRLRQRAKECRKVGSTGEKAVTDEAPGLYFSGQRPRRRYMSKMGKARNRAMGITRP